MHCVKRAEHIYLYILQIMKQEHSELSREAHECADSIPDLDKMVFAVQSLGTFRTKSNNVSQFTNDAHNIIWVEMQLNSVKISK